MTNWYKQAESAFEDKMVKKIKETIKSHPFFIPLFKAYHVPVDDIDKNLLIKFEDLRGKYAEGNGHEIKIDKSLLNTDFISKNFHYIVHELFHWLKRRTEELFYFNDDEEVQAFCLAMAWELLDEKPEEYVKNLFFPIVAGHFKDKNNASDMFSAMMQKAKDIVKKYK